MRATTKPFIYGMRSALLLLLAPLALHAAATLDGVNLGTYVNGPKITAEDLKGRVVLFEYWGVNCPPCRASIPHLASWQKEYDRDSFVIVANHCQGGGADNARKVWLANGGGDQISVVDGGDLPGSNVSGIPHCFLFGADGKLIFDGSPFEVETALKKAVEASPGHLVAGYEWKKLKKEAAAIGKRQAMATALKSARKVQGDGKDADAVAEAAELLKRVDAWAAKQRTAAEAARAGDPAESWRIAGEMAAALKGDAVAEPFETLLKELKADKAAQAAIKAAELLAKVKAQAEAYGLAKDPEGFLARASNKAKAQEIAQGLKAVASKHAGTKAASEAEELARTWKLGG